MIAGEGIVGILLAVLAVLGVADKIDLSGVLNLSPAAGFAGSLIFFAVMISLTVMFTKGKKEAPEKAE